MGRDAHVPHVPHAADEAANLARGGTASEWIDGCARYLDLRVRD